MNYSRNIPDWQQYNALQSGGTDGSATAMAAVSTGQSANPNHPFVPSISPPSMGGMNPATDCLGKSQSNNNFGSRNYQTPSNVSNGCNNLGTSPLTSMVHMSNCIGHYGSSNNMNPMMDDINNAMDHHRSAMNEEMAHRNNTISMSNGPVSHMMGPNMNVNSNMGVPDPRIPPTNPIASNRQTSYMPCKATCCSIPDSNMTYQGWDKFNGYQPGVPYRENMHLPNYNSGDRRFRGGNINYRKDTFTNKTLNPSNQYHMDQRRNYTDYNKFRKDSATVPRNYQQPSVILSNYAMQNYNVPGDYQKYLPHYPMKNYPLCGAPMTNAPPNSVMKQAQYQSNGMMQNSQTVVVPNVNATPSMQNSYYNAQNGPPRDYSRVGQEGVDANASMNRMQPPTAGNVPSPKHQMYRQKFAIQRYSLENQLREMSQVPGYMSNPKYKECAARYQELLKLQRTVEFQNSIHESSMNSNASPVGPPISPINLQFDQNGVLINSNFLPTNYTESNTANAERKQGAADAMNQQQNMQMLDQTVTSCPPQQESSPTSNQKIDQRQDFPAQTVSPVQQNKGSKEFANKPELDVRQFLATWDESEDDENATANVLSKVDGPVAVVDVNLVTDARQEFEVLQGNPSNQGNNASASNFNNTMGIDKVVSVVGCISGDGSEVPTIHIVDNVENKIVVEKLENALNGINNSNIKRIQELLSKQNSSTETTTQRCNSCGLANESSEKHLSSGIVDGSNKSDDVNRQNSTIQMSNLRRRLEMSANTNKQNEINNVELTNSDDLSLPDLSTPVSTTLNTPTHSDNEKSLDNVVHLKMSSNPIDIMQSNSIISFTQSPIKIVSYEKRKSSQDGLQFDFTQATNDEVMENFLGTSEPSKSIMIETSDKERKNTCCDDMSQKTTDNTLEYEEVDRNELLPQEWFSPTPVQYDNEKSTTKDTSLEEEILNMNSSKENTSSSSSKDLTNKNDSINSKLQNKNAVETMNSKKSKETIDDLNAVEKSTSSVRNDTLFCATQDREKYISMSLDDEHFYTDTFSNASNIIPLIAGEDNEEPRMPVPPMEGNCLTKIMKDSAPITDLNVLGSDDEKLDKVDDIWMEFTCMEKNLNENLDMDLETTNKEKHSQLDMLKKMRKHSKRSKFEKIKDSLRHINRKLDLDSEQSNSSVSSNSILESNFTKTIDDTSKTGDSNNLRVSKEYCKSSARFEDRFKKLCDSLKKKSKESRRRSKSVEPNISNDEDQLQLLSEFRKLKRKRSIGNPLDKDNMHELFIQRMKTSQCNTFENRQIRDADVETSVCNNESRSMDDVSQSTSIVCRPKSNEVFEEVENNSKLDKSKKSDFEIQLSNVNLRINEQDIRKSLLTMKDKNVTRSSDAMDSIKIEINVSCSENKHSVTKSLEFDGSTTKDNISLHNKVNNKDSDEECIEIMCDTVKTETVLAPSHCKKLTEDKSNKESSENSFAESNQNVKLPHKISRDSTCVHNDFHSLKFSECLTPVITENPKDKITTDEESIIDKSLNNSTKKESEPVISSKKFDILEYKDQTDLSRNLSNYNFGTDDFLHTTKLFECSKSSKDPLSSIRAFDNLQSNLKCPKLLTSLNIDSFLPKYSLNIDHSDPCGSSSKHFIEKMMNLKLNKFDALPYNIQPMTFKNYASESKYQGSSILSECENSKVPSGFFNPAFTILDDYNNMNTVPVYTTKDGKIKYSPNRKYTYQVLIKEARDREKPQFESSSAHSHHSSHQKSRQAWKRKSDHEKKVNDSKSPKNASAQFCKYKRHKYDDRSTNKSPEKNEVEKVRNCSVIAVAPSNTLIDCDIKIVEESQSNNELQRELINSPITEMEIVKDDKHTLYKENTFFEETTSEEHIVENENRSTVIKQLGVLSHDNKVTGFDNDMKLTVEDYISDKACLTNLETVKCTSVIQKDDSNNHINENVFDYEIVQESNKDDVTNNSYPTEGVLRHSNSTTVIPSSMAAESKDSEKEINPSEIFHDKLMCDSKKIKNRRNSISHIECSVENVIIPRRKSLESNIVITSAYHDSQDSTQDFENDAVSNSENVSIENAEENIQKINQHSMCEELENYATSNTGNVIITNADENAQGTLEENYEKSFLSVPMIPTEESIFEPKEINETIEIEIISHSPKDSEEVFKDPKNSIFEKVEFSDKTNCLEYTENEELYVSNNDNLLIDCSATTPIETFKNNSEESNIPNNDVSMDECSVVESTEMFNSKDEESNIHNNDNLKDITAKTVDSKDEETVTIVDNAEFACRTEVYLEYNNVIIKEEKQVDEEEEKVSFNDKEKYDKVDVQVHQMNYSDLTNSVLNQPDDIQIFRCEEVATTVEETICFENKFVEEVITSEVSVVNEKSTQEETVKVQESLKDKAAQDKEKAIPKLVIRKSDSTSAIFSHAKSSSEDISVETKRRRSDSRLKHPKIPKMIIRNANSRPQTPTIEEISKSSLKTSNLDSKAIKCIRIRSEEKGKKEFNASMSESKSKVPKMKIKLEDKLPKVVIENINIHEIQKTVPKMKIKKVRSSTLRIIDDQTALLKNTSSDNSKNDTESRSYDAPILENESSRDKIPKLKIKKDSSSVLSSKIMRKRSNSSASQTSSKKPKKWHEESTTRSSEYECDTNDSPSISDKVPKVIIKRTSARSEFKCELSKTKRNAPEWQPHVALRRSWILDCMAKKLRHMKLALKLATPRNIDRICAQNNVDPNKLQWDKFISDLKKQSKLSTSGSDVFSEHSRKRKNVLSIVENDSDSDSTSSEFYITCRSFDENMNSRDKIDNTNSNTISNLTNKNGNFQVTLIKDEKDEYITDDACFENISPRQNEKVENGESLRLCPITNDDDPYAKLSTLSTSQKLYFDIPRKSISNVKCESRSLAPFEDVAVNADSDLLFTRNASDEDVSKSKSVDVSFDKGDMVITVESSDESQTTIEILQASPDTSREELDIANFRHTEPIYTDNAVPTQVELMELEVNSVKTLEVPILKEFHENVYDNAVDNIPNKIEDLNSKSKSRSQKEHYHTSSKHRKICLDTNDTHSKDQNHEESHSERLSSKNRDSSKRNKSQSSKFGREKLSYSDMLAKEVLAAKETLKRCFRKDSSMCNTRPKTITENKKQQQHSSISQKRSKEHASLSKDDNKKAKVSTNESQQRHSRRHRDSGSKHRSRSRSKSSIVTKRRHSRSRKAPEFVELFDTTISLKSIKNSSRDSNAKNDLDNAKVTKKLAASDPTNRQFVHSFQKAIQVIGEMNKVKPYKNSKTSESRESDESLKEDMPVLEPQVNVNFESAPDRDTSRSPPVITTPEIPDLDQPKNQFDKVASQEPIRTTKIKQDSDMTIADVVRELVFHEKATIKHRRYCILCERWFPSILKHQRHLAGYQHRHMELTQRRTIHTLFTLFTGKPCPKLLSPDIKKVDCSPGEPTPLQIVVQDIVMDCVDVRADKKEQSENNT